MKELIEEILSLLELRKKSLVRISGHGAAGKTTFAKALMEYLNSNSYNYLNADPYIIQGKYRKPLEVVYKYKGEIHKGKVTACMPVAHELEGLKRDLLMIKNGMDFMSIDMPWFPARRIHANLPITIVDGMSAAFLDESLFDLSIYIYTDAETELERRMERDVRERGRTVGTLLDSHRERRRQYERFMHDKRKVFDIIINDSKNQFVIEKKMSF